MLCGARQHVLGHGTEDIKQPYPLPLASVGFLPAWWARACLTLINLSLCLCCALLDTCGLEPEQPTVGPVACTSSSLFRILNPLVTIVVCVIQNRFFSKLNLGWVWVLVLLPFLPRVDRKTGSSNWLQSQAHSIQPVREGQASDEKLFPFLCSLFPSGRVTPDLFKWEVVIFVLNQVISSANSPEKGTKA